jgi:type IV pilus secretin PilQ/predicted competence protein
MSVLKMTLVRLPLGLVCLSYLGCANIQKSNPDFSPATSEKVVAADASQEQEAARTTTGAITGAKNAPVASLGAETANGELIDVNFTKSAVDAGSVEFRIQGRPKYDLKRTAPSEYVLSLTNTKVGEDAKPLRVAAKGAPGIRSVRVLEKKDDAVVRMFVDPTVELQVKPNANGLTVVAISAKQATAMDPSARAQFVELGDQPKKDGAAADGAKSAVANEVDQIARANPTGIRSNDGSKTYTGRLISLDLQDTDIDNALRIIAEVSNLNIIASDDVTGKVTLRLIDVPWDQALDVILKTNGLDQVTEGNVIRIAPINKLREEREALREAKRAQEMLENLQVKYFRVSYARVEDIKSQVEGVLTERGSVGVDSRTNQLIVKDTSAGIDAAAELLKKLDLRTPQVLLETQIVESGRSLLRDLGFQWNFSYIQSPATGNSTGLNFPNTVAVGGQDVNGGPGDFAFNFPAAVGASEGTVINAILSSADGSKTVTARLTALENENKIRVISRPQIATVNNKEAQVRSVETLRVRTPSSGTAVSTGSGAQASAAANNAFQEIEVGITLRVTPQASPDHYVLMDVNARSSTLGTERVDNIPSTLDREATSTVLVKSGQTFALGGVYRLTDVDGVSGVPFLKDMPFLGWAFRRQVANKRDEELIFFITPHIVEGSFDPSLM